MDIIHDNLRILENGHRRDAGERSDAVGFWHIAASNGKLRLGNILAGGKKQIIGCHHQRRQRHEDDKARRQCQPHQSRVAAGAEAVAAGVAPAALGKPCAPRSLPQGLRDGARVFERAFAERPRQGGIVWFHLGPQKAWSRGIGFIPELFRPAAGGPSGHRFGCQCDAALQSSNDHASESGFAEETCDELCPCPLPCRRNAPRYRFIRL